MGVVERKDGTGGPRLDPNELSFLHDAARFFKNPGILVKGLNLLAIPVEKGQKFLPQRAQLKIRQVVELSLRKALAVSLRSIGGAQRNLSLSDASASSIALGKLHSSTTAVTGAVSGFFGLPALFIELPVSTVVMLRSIAKIAQEFGEDLSKPEAALECLMVFSFGGPSPEDDLSDTAYYGNRMAMSAAVKEAAIFLAGTSALQIVASIEKGMAPQLVRFLAEVATLFEVRVTKKLLMQATPVIGAAGGAVVNVAFCHFFSEVARFHFGIRQLERKYGEVEIKAVFGALSLSK